MASIWAENTDFQNGGFWGLSVDFRVKWMLGIDSALKNKENKC